MLAAPLLGGCEGCNHDHDHPHGDHGHDHDDHGHDDHGHDDHGAHDDHGHDDGPPAIGVTRFTERLALYAEHPPVVAGQEFPFLAHLTIVDGHQPLPKATVTLILDGPKHVEAKTGQAVRSGIFRIKMTAPPAGNYRGTLRVESDDLKADISDFEVQVFPNASEAAKAAPEEDAANTVTFLLEQQWQVPFAVEPANAGRVVPTTEVAGEVTTPPGGQADVGAAISGRVVAPPSGLPHPGQVVKKGQLLATVAPAPASPEAGARADLAVAEAEARLQTARAAVERGDRLLADRAISEREVEEARRELDVAEEALGAAKRARSIFAGAASGRGAGTYRVTAPIDGVVADVRATEGRTVTSGELLFRVVSLDQLWIRARVPEQQAASIRSDEDGSFRMQGVDEWLPLDVTGDDATAEVVNVGRTVDPRSRTVEVIYALKEPDDRLRVGAMVRVAVPTGAAWKGTVTARRAILEDDGRSVIFVQVSGEAFEERSVRVGPRSGALVGILSGLEPGEQVVTVGANVIRLSAGAASGAGHGHVH